MTGTVEALSLYVGCSLAAAPDDFKQQVAQLKNQLAANYTILEFKGQVDGTNEDVYRWDIEQCVATCDVFLAVCDYPSLGLGWELNEAIRLGKPTLGVAHQQTNISRLVLGAAEVKPNFSFARYNNLLLDIPGLLAKHLKKGGAPL